MAIERYGIRLLAIFTCLVLCFYVCAPKLSADGGVITVPSAAIIVTLAVGAGVVFATSEDARNFVQAAWQEIQTGGAKWEMLKAQLHAANIAYMQNGIQGLRDNVNISTITEIMRLMTEMGMDENGSDLKNSLAAFTIGSLVSDGGKLDPYSMFGDVFAVENVGSGVKYVVGRPIVSSGHVTVYYQYLDSWDGKSLNSSNGYAYRQWALDQYYLNDSKYVLATPYPVIVSYKFNAGYETGLWWTVVDSKEDHEYQVQYSGGDKGPSFSGPNKIMTVAVALGALVKALQYHWQQKLVNDLLQQQPEDKPIYFSQVVTPNEAAGLQTHDVIDWEHMGSETPSESSEPSESSGPIDEGSPVTIGGLLTLFIPQENYLSRKFNDVLTRFPELGDLEELRGLTTLGERKLDARIVLNNYFGISTNQTGVNIDIWDDKRKVFKGWIRAFLIVMTIIYTFNQCYKLVRSGVFTDTGSGDSKVIPSSKGGRKGP